MNQIDLFKDWAAAPTVTLTAAALIAVLGVAATILTTANRTRREHRASLDAEALSAVGNYLERPYRIRRKDGTPTQPNTITAGLSDVTASIDHSQSLLRLHAPHGVADAYDHYLLALAAGLEPLPGVDGSYDVAASFALRHFGDAEVQAVPSPGVLAAIKELYPVLSTYSFYLPGQLLSESDYEYDGTSFRYAVVNIAGSDWPGLFADFVLVETSLGFRLRVRV